MRYRRMWQDFGGKGWLRQEGKVVLNLQDWKSTGDCMRRRKAVIRYAARNTELCTSYLFLALQLRTKAWWKKLFTAIFLVSWLLYFNNVGDRR